MVKASDVMDLPEVAAAVGWTIQSARVMYSRSRWNREAGTPGRADLPPPLRTVSGRYPIWTRSQIEAWIRLREKRCKQCGDPVTSILPAGAGHNFECARCAGLEDEMRDE